MKLNDSDNGEVKVVKIIIENHELLKTTTNYQLSKKIQWWYYYSFQRRIWCIMANNFSGATKWSATFVSQNGRDYHNNLLSEDVFEAFCVQQITKPNGKQCSYIGIVFDTILYYAYQLQHYLSTSVDCVSKWFMKEK